MPTEHGWCWSSQRALMVRLHVAGYLTGEYEILPCCRRLIPKVSSVCVSLCSSFYFWQHSRTAADPQVQPTPISNKVIPKRTRRREQPRTVTNSPAMMRQGETHIPDVRTVLNGNSMPSRSEQIFANGFLC